MKKSSTTKSPRQHIVSVLKEDKEKDSRHKKVKKVRKVKDNSPTYFSIFQTVFILLSLFPACAYLYNFITWPSCAFYSSSGFCVYQLSSREVNLKLENFPFESRFKIVDSDDNLTLHYVDEGGLNTHILLLLHDAPLWSFTYRKLISIFSMAKLRVIAVDLIGFGRSDKPSVRKIHTIENHMRWITSLLDQIAINEGITLFAMGRAGLLALSLMKSDPNRYSRIVLGNSLFYSRELSNLPFSHKLERYITRFSPYLSPTETLKRNTLSQHYYSLSEITEFETAMPHHAHTVAWSAITDWSLPCSEKKISEFTDFYENFTKPMLILTSKDYEVGTLFGNWFKTHVPGAAHQLNVEYNTSEEYIQENHASEIANQVMLFLESKS